MIRLYDKYELSLASTKDQYSDRLQSQYDFAKDNLGSLGINLGGEGADGGRVTAQNLNKILISKFMPDNLHRWFFGHHLRSFIHHRLSSSSHDATEELRLEVPAGQLQV